jgi:hypothetical protein
VFQRGAIERFTIGPPSDDEGEWSIPVKVNAQIAVARSARIGANGGDEE